MWHPMRVAGRLLLRDAGLAEHTPAAEGVVAEISNFLNTRGMGPFVKDRRLRDAPPLAAPPAGLREVARRALRESPYTRELARDAARPCSLQVRPAAREAVERARVAGDPLPLFHESARALRCDRALSVRREALQEWLKSEMATAWRKEQAAISARAICRRYYAARTRPTRRRAAPGAPLALRRAAGPKLTQPQTTGSYRDRLKRGIARLQSVTIGIGV